MKPPPFRYTRPGTVQETLELLARYGATARILAGGQSLVPAMNARVAHPGVLIDINRVPGLDGIDAPTGGGLVIGAMARQAAVEHSRDVQVRQPIVAEAVSWIGWPQVRNRGTFGGSLAQADRHAELPAVALLLGAALRARSVRGARTIAADDFFTGAGNTLDPDELLVDVTLPAAPVNSGAAFLEVCRRASGVPVVAVAARVILRDDGAIDRAEATIAGAAPRAIRAEGLEALTGQAPSDAAFAEAGRAAAAGREVDPYENVHGDARYRRHLVSVLTRRALAQAAARAA
ncbi:MAG: FAD binding domain-containing protein [Alphaproteobacteria bacterium]|nr:FAD binding domain-containing protein [Alphaproteobacteria bacterium]